MGRKVVDMIGKKYGSLTAVRFLGIDKYKRLALWECVCDCGNTTVCTGADLRSGAKRSCGCSRRKPRKPKADACVICGAPQIKARNMCSRCYMEWWQEKHRKEMERYL